MNISPDGVTVRFKTEPEDLFRAEKSGAKPNTVRVVDAFEAEQMRRNPPEKIIVQYRQEVFLRTITHIHFTWNFFGKVVVVISWTNEKHHHPIFPATDHGPGDHNMSFDPAEVCLQNGETATGAMKIEVEGVVDKGFVCVIVSKNLHRSLQSIAHERSMNSIIQEMYEEYLYTRSKETVGDHNLSFDPAEDCLQNGETATEVMKTILIPRTLLAGLNLHRGMTPIPEFISKLLEEHRTKRAEERGPLHD